MKVRFDKKDKKYFTMAEAPIINAIIKDMKTSEDTVENAIEYAMHALDEYNSLEILKSDAVIAHNGRIFNYYNDESGTIDIWIDAVVMVQNSDAFYKIGFYLSNAWSISVENHQEIASHMYIKKYIFSVI